MRNMQQAYKAAALAAALTVCFSPANAQVRSQPAKAQQPASGTAPQSTLRLVSETPVQTSATAPTVSADELASIARDAYIYAYPLVLMEITRQSSTNVASAIEGKAPVNQFGHRTSLPDPRAKDTPWPTTDMLYSNLWFDVSREPLIVRLPDAGDRYVSLSLLDMWSDTFASRGTRVNGSGAQTFAIVGPHWQGTVPAGVDVLRSPTNQGWVLGRVEVRGSEDLAAVNQFQSGWSAVPYSQSAKPGWPTPTQPATKWEATAAPSEIVGSMDAQTFWGWFAQAIASNPPHANDHAILDRMRRIGIGAAPGAFQFARLNPTVQQALADEAPEAGARIRNAVSHLGVPANNWYLATHGIGSYGTDYLRRAAVAYAGLGANPPADVLYPVAFADDRGEKLDANNNYVIRFDKGQLPPVNAFWSLSAYDQTFNFVPNEADRYTIRSTDALHYNSDGSLDIYVQRKAPRESRRANWLPIPQEGPFLLKMRLYSPQDIALDGGWAPPPVRKD